MMKQLICRMMEHSLRQSFRRVCWVGPPPAIPAERPVILYANHHSYYDGYLLWLVVDRLLRRPAMTWMAEWDRFPLFAPVGAQPFPPDDPVRRARTFRRTHRRFSGPNPPALIYFPEGTLHPPDEGILPFDATALQRLDRLFPPKYWLPVVVHVTWWGEPLPTALLTSGAPHETADGQEEERLRTLLDILRQDRPRETMTLLEGRAGAHESWNLSLTRRWFSRYL